MSSAIQARKRTGVAEEVVDILEVVLIRFMGFMRSCVVNALERWMLEYTVTNKLRLC